jgi:hypothetical protein
MRLRIDAKPEHCLPNTPTPSIPNAQHCVRIARRWNFIFGGIHIRSSYGRGLGLDMGGRHASYRANPGRPLLLLPALRCPLFGDVFAAVEER